MARNTKMPRNLVALSASAVAAVYLAGFGVTQAADTSLGQAAAATPTAITTTASGAQSSSPSVLVAPTGRQRHAPSGSPASTPSTSVAGASATQTSGSAAPSTSTAPSTSSSSATASAYKDGNYTGTGMSRRGGIAVSVTVQGGRITNVQITGSSTEYPVSRISSLPGQVVSKQSAQVNNVSGATYSAQAFQLAVQQALSKAKA